jgi:hypothetical protein
MKMSGKEKFQIKELSTHFTDYLREIGTLPANFRSDRPQKETYGNVLQMIQRSLLALFIE